MFKRPHSRGQCVCLVSLVCVTLWTLWTCQRESTTSTRDFRAYPGQYMCDQGREKRVPGNNFSDVLLFGYWRSGSTFTGAILGNKKKMSYTYEPLGHTYTGKWKLVYFKPGYICSIWTTQCNKTDNLHKEAVNVVSTYYICKENKGWDGKKPCSNVHAAVTKVNRLSMSLARQLLDRFPKLKLVYLVRDPRAMMLSRTKSNANITFPGCAQTMCQKIQDDYIDFMKLKNVYPGRMHNVYYEDLATNTMETVRRMFDFVGFTFDENDRRRIQDFIKSPPGVKNRRKNVFRINANSTAYAWRTSIPDSVLTSVNEACSRTYDLLGYPQMKTRDDLNNDSIPLRYKSN